MKAAVPDSTSRAKFPLAPVTQNVRDCRHLEILPGNECLRTVPSQGGWDTAFWGKAVSAFQQSLPHTNTEHRGSWINRFPAAPCADLPSLTDVPGTAESCTWCPQYPTRVKRPGPSLSSPSFLLAFLGHRVSAISAPENHSLGSSGGRTGTALALS